jgi:peptidoglycan glycosyltransferase
MAHVAATIANEGVRMRPSLVDRLVSENGEERRIEPVELGRAMTVATAGAIRDAMVRAVEGPYASGFAGGAAVPGIVTAGKGGTAQLAPGETPHSWFIGFAPAQSPRIAIAVVVENGGSGSERAVPMAGRLMTAYLTRFLGR